IVICQMASKTPYSRAIRSSEGLIAFRLLPPNSPDAISATPTPSEYVLVRGLNLTRPWPARVRRMLKHELALMPVSCAITVTPVDFRCAKYRRIRTAWTRAGTDVAALLIPFIGATPLMPLNWQTNRTLTDNIVALSYCGGEQDRRHRQRFPADGKPDVRFSGVENIIDVRFSFRAQFSPSSRHRLRSTIGIAPTFRRQF